MSTVQPGPTIAPETGRMLTCEACGAELARLSRSLEGVVVASRCRTCA